MGPAWHGLGGPAVSATWRVRHGGLGGNLADDTDALVVAAKVSGDKKKIAAAEEALATRKAWLGGIQK